MVTSNNADQKIKFIELDEELKKKRKTIPPKGYVFDYEKNEFVPATREQVAERESYYEQNPYVGPPGTPGKITPQEYDSQLSTLTKSLYPEKFQPGTSYGYKPEELPAMVLKQARENAIENIQTFAEDLNQRGTLQDRQAMLSLLGVQPEDVDQLLGTTREQQAKQLTKQVLPEQDINEIIDNPQEFINQMQSEENTESKRQLLTTYGFTPDEIDQIMGVQTKVMNVNGIRKQVIIKANGSVTDLSGADVGTYDQATDTISQPQPVPTTDQFVEEYFKEKGWNPERKPLVLANDIKGLQEYDQRLIEASDKYKEQYGVTNWLKSGLAKLVSTIASSFWAKKYIQPTPEEPTGLETGFAALDIAVFTPLGLIIKPLQSVFKAGKFADKAWNGLKLAEKTKIAEAVGLDASVAQKTAKELAKTDIDKLAEGLAKATAEATPSPTALKGQGVEAAGTKEGAVAAKAAAEVPPVKPPKPPVAEGVTPEPSEPVINKLIDVLNEQKGLRKSTTATQKAALAPKFKGIEELRQVPEGEASVAKIGAALKGELGHEVNPSYVFTQIEKDELYNNITQSVLKDSEIFPAQKALMRLLDPDKFAMRFPDDIADMPLRNFEIKYFEKVWGKDVAKQLATDSKLFRVTSTINDAFWELRYNSLLSGKAQIRNMVSNIVRTMTNPVESLASVAGELPLRLIPGYKRARFAGEAVQETIGAVGGIRGGVKEALHTLATGERYAEGLAKYELPERVFTGKLGKILNIPSIGMDAGDMLFRKPLTQSNIYKLAYRQASQEGLKGAKFAERLAELKANPTPEMMLAARDATNSSLFRENTKLSGLIIKLRDYKIPGTGFQPFREAAMFVRVPINVASYGLARSPVGAMNPRLWANIAAKDPKAADQIGRVMLGSSVAAAFYTYVAEGGLAGAPPKSEAERNLWSLQGKIPFAAKIGNKWVQYSQIPLIGTTLFEMAQTFDAIKDEDKSAPEKVAKLTYDLAHFFTEQTPLAGMSNFLNAMTDPERYAEQWVENYVPSLIPYSAALRVGAQAVDEIVRKPQSVGEAIMAALPWLSELVPPKLDIMGEEVKRTTPWWSPLNVGLDKETVLTKELDRLNVNIGMAGTSIAGTKLSDEEQLKYQEITGKTINKDVSELMLLPDYWKADDATRTQMLDKAVTGARNWAREKMQEQIWASGTTEERLATLQTALAKSDSQLGKVISETPTLSGEPSQIYDLKTELDSSYRTLFKNIPQESLKGVNLPPTAESWFTKEKAKATSSALSNRALIDIQPGKEDKTTFEDYYLQWQKRGQITDERELEKFDKEYPNANLGNFTRRQLDLLRTYNKFDDAGKKTFLEGLSESDKKAITANAYTDWLKSNPKDNAQLAIWGDAKILTKEAYTEFRKLVGSLDVVDLVIPKLTMPPEGSIDNYFKYQDMVAEGKNSSWEAQLMMAKDTKLRDFLGLKPSDTRVASLELKVKNAETQRKYDELTDKEARDQFRAGNPKWVDDLRRIEAIESNGEAVAEKYVEYGKTIDKFSASSAEAKLFRVDNPDLEKWGTERKDGWQPIDQTQIPVWRIDAQFRKEDAAYTTLKDDKARADYLAKNSLYRIARRQREAIQKGVDSTNYTTYYELPDKGYRRERFLKENPDFATSMNLRVPDKVPSEGYDTLLEKPNPTPQDKLTMDAYKLYVPDKMVGNYVAYRTLPKGEYEDDWYLQEHPDFYKEVYLDILKNERKDYRKVPSRQVYAKYQQYQGIYGEVAKDAFRDKNRDLDAWLVTKFGYVSITEKKRRESLTSTEKGKEKSWQQGEDWKRKLKEIEGLLVGVR